MTKITNPPDQRTIQLKDTKLKVGAAWYAVLNEFLEVYSEAELANLTQAEFIPLLNDYLYLPNEEASI